MNEIKEHTRSPITMGTSPLLYHHENTALKTRSGASLSGSVSKNLPANAGDVGSIPPSGRSHMRWRNEACVPTTIEDHMPQSLCSATKEAQNEEQALLTTTKESSGTVVKPTIAKKSDQISRSVVSDSLRPHELQHARPPCPSPTPRVH